MEKIQLGKTGLEVTRLGLGGIQITKITEADAVRVIKTGLDLGITFLETGRGYGDSEEKMGKAIKGNRSNVVIITKSPANDAKEMLEKIHQSLKAFGTDYIDLYQYHGCDKRETYEKIIAPGGVLEGLEKAKQAGKIRAIGFSSHQLDLALQIIEDDFFASAQLPISFMNVENHEKGLFACAKRKDLGLIAMKPFGGGRLGNARLCMGYVLGLEGVVAAVGVDSADHVRELVELAENPPLLDENDRREMEKIRRELGTGFCRACNYCQPCPEDIKISPILWLPVYIAQMGLEKTLTKDTIEMVRHSENCIQCRECEQRCPFNLQIVDTLAKRRATVEELIIKHKLDKLL